MAIETGVIGEKVKLSSSAHNFPIVGIGASAGGLDAYKQLLQAIPIDSEMAYVVVQHLNPAHESKLTEILSRVTKIPIQEITDEVKIFPNNIYVMPSGKILTSVDGVLKLTPRANIKTNLVIDIFFTSIAVVWESMAVGVVLSGTGADGTLGLKMIKNHGGTTIVQDESAEYDDMPQSAVDANVVDFVLPAGKIPAQLLKLNNAAAVTHTDEEEQLLLQSDEVVFLQVLQLLLKRSGVDFTYYKQSTIRRRIGRRIALHKRGNLADYLKYLQTDNDALDALFQDMLISVTSFFRDPKTFDALTGMVLPALIKSKPAEDAIRFWIAGCTTGEETYSIAICLHELLGKNLSGKKIQIFASDISATAIKKARAGIYSIAELKSVSEERLNKYFTKADDSYQINKAVRDMCVFANHNFLKDPPFGKMDMISCRNVLIYMEPFLQKKALTTFHYALKTNGILLLGKAETVSAAAELFTSVDNQHKFYTRNTGEGRFMQVASVSREDTITTQNTETKKEVLQPDFRNSANDILISKSPAAVIINEAMDIVHIHGDITAFLKPAPGKPSFNLLKMAREGLGFELRNAIYKVKISNDTVIKEDIQAIQTTKKGITDPALLVTIEVIALTDTIEPHYLIVFTKKYHPPISAPLESDRVRHLENELVLNQKDMLSITEKMEAANEELKSSNEELQSLNQELATSGQELQSSNEELTSLNLELVDKELQLNAARAYSEGIVSTIKEPLVVLDKNFRINFANKSFYKKFNINQKDTDGKIFYEIQNHQWDVKELRTLLEETLTQKKSIEDFDITLDFFNITYNFLLNAKQIINEKSNEPLILLSIQDVTDNKLNKKLKASEVRLRDFIMQAPAMLALLKEPEHIFELISPLFRQFLGGREVIGKALMEAIPEIKGQGIIELVDTVYKTGETFTGNEMPVMIDTGGMLQQFYLNFTFQAFKNDEGETKGIMVFAYDVTEQITAHKRIKASEQRAANERMVLYNSFMKAPGGIAILKGDSHIYEFANDTYEKLVGRSIVIGKTVLEHFPEIERQGYIQMLDKVFSTGEPLINNEIPIELDLKGNGILEKLFLNLVVQPLKDEKGITERMMAHVLDVTEAVNARKLIEESELFNRTILESSPDCLKVLDIEGRIQYMNFNGLCQMEIDDFVTVENKNWWSLWGKENEAVVQAAIDKALTGETAQFTALCATIKGTPKWWDVVVSPVGKPGEPVHQIISVSRDITEKKKTEAAIEKLASHLKLATDSANVGTWSLNLATQQLEWNALHKQMWGYDEHRTDLTYKNWHKLILPLDKEETFKKIEDAKVNQTAYDVTYRIARANDEAVHYIRSVGKYYYNEMEEAESLTGISIDITEQKEAEEKIKQSEERFRNLAETLPQLVWITNEKGEYEYASRQWLEYSGLDPHKEETWAQLVHPVDIQAMMNAWEKSLQTGQTYVSETRLKSKDNEYRWHVVQGEPVRNEKGKIIKWIGAFTDIHEQKIIEQKKDEFISIASHEMKTPLTTAKGYIELLLLSLSEKKQTALYATKANQAVEKLHDLVTDLLDASKIQNGQLNYKITTFDFNIMLDETIENTQLIAKNYTIHKTGNCSQQITGDRSRLQQVVINLLNNAVKYSPKADKVLVKIEEKERKILVSVQDFGVGMSANHLDKIFDKYYRVEEHAINFQGLGIGLYISYNIIERHNGNMWAESKAGKGSTFYFTLPL